MGNYLKNINASQKIISWFEKRIKEPCELSEQEHIADFFVSKDCPKRFERMTYDEAKRGAEKWIKKLQKQAKDIKETEKDTEVELDFKDGFKFVKLVGKNAYDREGKLMRHCVSSYYGKDDKIYSLRDSKNAPHCTISSKSQQIKGKGNGSIHPKYIKYVVEFLEYLKVDVRDSEMQNLGYINISKYRRYLNDESKKKLFKKKYWYKDDKLFDKDNDEFATLDILGEIPLIQETTVGIKVNFDLPSFIKASVDFLLKRTYKKGKQSNKSSARIGSSGHYTQIGSSGDSAKIGSSGYAAQIGSSGDAARIGSSGDAARIGSSGDSAQIGSSGDAAQIGSSGDAAQIGSSGDAAQIGSSGDSAKIGSSGHYTQIGSSGHYTQIGSSGHYTQIGSSGHYTQIGSSGYSARIDVEGKDSVCAAIGCNSRIKAKKGCWITLAEYDNNKPLCVKSVIIDGKKIKENTWYELKNKKFTEIK